MSWLARRPVDRRPPMEPIVAALRFVAGWILIAVAVSWQILVLLVLLPSRNLRIRSCNYWGQATAWLMLKLSGCPMTIEGLEHLDPDRPAIYISNHSSVMDAFLAMYLSPVGTCGVVKKEIIWWPFFGQMYFLSGHLRIDRSNREAAIQSMASLAEDVRRFGLSIFMWPEGTRARDGKLLPFKKGAVHMALSTGLPIVPIIVTGAHRAWQKGSIRVRKVPIDIAVLPAIDTSGWSKDDVDQHTYDLWALMKDQLPEDQQPVVEMAKNAA